MENIVQKSIVIDSPGRLHGRPAHELVEYFKALNVQHPGIQTRIQLDRLPDVLKGFIDSPEFNPINIMDIFRFIGALTILGENINTAIRKFTIVLKGPEVEIEAVMEKTQRELQAIAESWLRKYGA